MNVDQIVLDNECNEEKEIEFDQNQVGLLYISKDTGQCIRCKYLVRYISQSEFSITMDAFINGPGIILVKPIRSRYQDECADTKHDWNSKFCWSYVYPDIPGDVY
jgi:hypothetical protein